MTSERPLRVVRDATAPPDPAKAQAPGTAPEAEVSRALQHLMERFDSFLRRTAARHGLRGVELDDVVQDLRVRIWKSFGTAESIRRANPTYMYRAAVSASLDVVRSRRTRKRSAASLDDVQPSVLASERIEAEDRVTEGDLSRSVHDALLLLAESRRGVVRMYLAGYDRHEIAALLGWTEGRTRNLLYRGLADLRTILRARGITPEQG